MARINNTDKYPNDRIVTESDFLIGTDTEDNKKTKTYPMYRVAQFIQNYFEYGGANRVISIGDILATEDGEVELQVASGGNVIFFDNEYYTKDTPNFFTFTPVVSGIKVLIVYALPTGSIFYMAEGEESTETTEPDIPLNALIVKRIIVSTDNILVEDVLSGYKEKALEGWSTMSLGSGSNILEISSTKHMKLHINDSEPDSTIIGINIGEFNYDGLDCIILNDTSNDIILKEDSVSPSIPIKTISGDYLLKIGQSVKLSYVPFLNAFKVLEFGTSIENTSELNNDGDGTSPFVTEEDIEDKLDKPTTTVTDTDVYSSVVLVDVDNNSAKYPAESLGKNVANSALTSVTGAKLTLGADWEINVGTGFYFGLKGLLNKSSDTTWNRLLMTDSNGVVAYSNGNNLLKSMPSLFTEAEKTAWKVEMNGGWTTNTMSVATISPPVLKRFDEPIYVVLRGANLNLNPANFSIQIVSSDGSTVIATIPNSQIQLNTVGTTLTFWYNYKDVVEGNYKFRLWNGVATYDTPTNLSIVTNTTDIDLSSVTWDFLTNPTWDSTNSSTGGVFNISTPATTSDTAEVIASAKSSKLFNIGENFVLEIQATFSQAGANIENNLYSYLGIGYDTTPNVLTKASIVSVESSRRNNATIKITNNQSNIQVITMPATVNVTFIKQYNLITTIVEGVSTSLVNTTISNNSDYALFIQLSRRIGTQSVSGAILKAYKF